MDSSKTQAVSDPPMTSLPDPAVSKQPPSPGLGFSFSWRIMLGLVVGLGLGLMLLLVATQGVSLEQVRARLSLAHPGWAALTVLTVLLTTTAKVVRWRTLVNANERPSFWQLGQALMIGKSLNALFPARIGDLARIYIAGERRQISRASILGTLVAEKAFDTLFFLISAGLALGLVPLPSWLNLPLVGGTAIGFLLILLALALPHRRWVGWLGRQIQHLPWGLSDRLPRFTERALSGLAALRDPRMAGTACLWSVVVWALAASTNVLLFRAFDLSLGLGSALLLLVVLYAGVTPPTSPGRLGIFHTLTVLTLEALGVDRVQGLAYATVLHAIVYIPEILPGAILLGVRLATDKKELARAFRRGPKPLHKGNDVIP